MPPDRVVRHLRTPSIDKLKARVASLNCYASHEVDDGTPAASLLAIAPGTTETSSSSARSASSRSSRSATGHMRQSDGHLALPSHPRGVPHLRGRSGTAPETMAPAPEPLVRSVLAKLGECADGEPTDADDMPGWYEIRPTRFGVRSETYLADHRKVPSAGAIFRCVAVQLFTSDDLAEDFAMRPGCVAHDMLCANRETELFILNILLPGPPALSLVHVFERTPVAQRAPISEHAHRLYDHFVAAEPAWRDRRLKILANCTGGPLAIRTAVPSRPAVIGNKMPLRWHRHERSLEVVLDVAFSSVAAPVWRLMRGVTRKVVLDLALIIEAKEDEQLPEQVLGCMQWHKPNIADAQPAPPLRNSSGPGSDRPRSAGSV
eukprot:CAMPEP_0119405746 /NCGR_PEP_ID=MMETSP1335-20130426/328_1 /TAXON_ID=259385 /ORGANISM="Chrysoculter rhomboideus, Strain RCC1486" /LENGTH=375 /DNA_ID=CAMNT_0007429787 /DNA_START=75 /DNA_END=1202 /DNA_ORIENTATION=+